MFFLNIRYGRIMGGGSSITQQLAKNLFFSFKQTWSRKIREALVAVQMEKRYTKDEILEAYCNMIYFGANAFGVEKAAQVYLGKHADELTLAEASFLANLPRSPANYNPYENFDVAKNRQQIVLRRMVDAGFITQVEADAAFAEPIELKRLNLLYGKANYYLDYVKNHIEKEFSRDVLYYGGLKIYTAMDIRLQSLAQEVIKKRLAELDRDLGYDDYELAPLDSRRQYLQAALVAIDPTNGKVKAMVGGRDYAVSPYNRAVENNRQAGSAFKPFTYLAAIDHGNFSPASVIVDSFITFKYDRQVWTPPNWDNKYFGPITLKTALTHSRNIVAAKLINIIGPKIVVEYAHRMGITSKLDPVLSLALGTSSVSPLEMTSAYGAFANGGIARQQQIIKYVEDASGNPLREYINQGERVVDPQSIYLVVDMLKNVVDEGTARRVRWMGFDRPCAGKTGTTNDAVDLWFVGMTPQLVTAVWVGFDEHKPVRERNGAEMSSGKAAVSIWTLFMKEAMQGEPYRDFKIPPGILFVYVDPHSGEIVPKTYPNAQQVAIKAGTQLARKKFINE